MHCLNPILRARRGSIGIEFNGPQMRASVSGNFSQGRAIAGARINSGI
jgi:hypothetical protein